MMNWKISLPAAFGVLGLAVTGYAEEPTADELRQQIDALSAKVNRIEASNAASAQQQATLSSVLDDAQRRSQLLQSGAVTGGFDGKEFFIGSADGSFKLVPNFQFQVRNNTNWTEDGKGDDSDDLDNGFEIRRLKFGIKGNAFSKDLKYDIKWAFARASGSATLENAFIQYKFAEDWAFKIGQFKDPTFREEIVSSSRQMAVDRTLVNELLAGGQTDFEQGVTLIYNPQDGTFRGEFGYIDGANSDNTGYQDQLGGPALGDIEPSYGGIARGEFKVMGDWKSYDDFSAMSTKTDLLVLGAGVNYTEGGDDNVLFHTVDVQYKSAALPISVFAAYIGANVDADGGEADGYNWGGLLQVSYMLSEKVEVFGRYDYTDLDAGDEYSEITVGGNYYFAGHNAKMSIDVSYLPDGSPSSESGIGIKESEDAQFVVRGQFQLAL